MSRFIWFVAFSTTLLVLSGGSGEDSCLKPLEPDDDSGVVNKKCTGRVIAAHTVLSELHCADFCLRHPLCRHYSFQFAGEERKLCELLAETGNDAKNETGYLCREFPRQENVLMQNASTECVPGRV